MTVRAILDTKGHQIESVEPDARLSAAIKTLAERKIGAVLVMSQGRIEGILSERDIVRVLGERGAAVLDEPVSAVMTRKVVSCKQADTVAAIMEMMTSGKFRHLPVVEDGRVVGLISIGDIVKWRVREYEAEQEAPEHAGADDERQRDPRPHREQVVQQERRMKRDHERAHDADEHVPREPRANRRASLQPPPAFPHSTAICASRQALPPTSARSRS